MADSRSRRRTRRHGLSYSAEYRAWQTMRYRCTVPTSPAWKDYGGRGITVCEAWLDDPTQFYRDMGPKPSPKHELDRIDNDAGYSPENCRWALRADNCRNRRSSHRIEHAGETLTIAGWAERTGLAESLLHARLKLGWDAERMLTTPARQKAAKGEAAHQQRHPCADCGKPVHLESIRCISCSNKNRALLRDAVPAVQRSAA
ncbi:hypothetical protein EA658_16440 [Pseudoxanthomonas winnipegensis]|uniref:HNH endonuclease n=1 Tax=Pseudoxanthomonas winnipegensis TaxID=2480810 RepID=A0ABY1WCF6_9GAMM|nr:hypothetical protein [Pseudoxanthomonas winnipegensis]TAA11251.1 hypothetical protein EA659_07855 [Pseudoxanthomonas winnipegensis]TAA18674.1 hypothetical protein EA658_16440 [Pseudoxanthomonas winnipegensis]TAH73950.1 hypothetical protein EA657_00305 [Pseudoxanthomonas winnipegensis]